MGFRAGERGACSPSEGFPMSNLQRWTEQAEAAAREAGHVIRRAWRRGGVEVRYKGPSNPVTEVDLESQRLIREYLLSRNPEHEFLGEEGPKKTVVGDYLWVVDPLDGTKNFAHGYPSFCVSIALEHRGEVIVGVIYDPLRDEVFRAWKGGGAHLNGESIQVSETPELRTALLVTGFAGGADLEYELFLALERRSEGVRRDGSAALNLAYVAAGRLDAYWQVNLAPWDMAAGSLIVQEAQGTVTNYSGRAFHSRGRQIVASNVRLHRPILEVIEPYTDEVEKRFPSVV